MHAAVVTRYDHDPEYGTFPDPVPSGPHEIVLEVLAAGLSPLVRSKANGTHYSSGDALPLVPGVDGVGRDQDGVLRYFVLDDAVLGAMAERTVVDRRRTVIVPAGADPVAVAGAANPAMSSWVALRRRIAFAPGSRVLVVGATGTAGRLAVQVAKLLGASSVVAAGRNRARLEDLRGVADDLVPITDDPAATGAALAAAAANVDVVLDYVWGPLAAATMAAIVRARPDRSKELAWVEIGSVGGLEAPIPSAALRSARLTIVGSGIGSVPARDLVEELGHVVAAIADGSLTVDVTPVPLAEVSRAWAADEGGASRAVLVP